MVRSTWLVNGEMVKNGGNRTVAVSVPDARNRGIRRVKMVPL